VANSTVNLRRPLDKQRGTPYSERRSAFGKERYSALGITREDWEARARAAVANWDCFGAPAALFCYIDRNLGLPQWADLGMYLQTVMLLLRTEGLHSCPQMAWSQGLGIELAELMIRMPAAEAHRRHGRGSLWGVRAQEAPGRRALYRQQLATETVAQQEQSRAEVRAKAGGVVRRIDGTITYGPIWDWQTRQVFDYLAR
jgi:hypothetical protein